MTADERREQLIRVAIGLFARRGFSGTTTKEIAQAAGVTEALIFRHFPTKEALYEAILLSRIQESESGQWATELAELAERRDDEGLIRRIAEQVLAFHRENVDFLRLMFYAVLEEHVLGESFRDRHVKPVYDFLCDYIELRQAEGAFVDVHPGAAVRAIFGMPFYHSIVNNLFHCHMLEIDDAEAVDTFVRLVLDGLRRPSGDA